MEHSTSRNLRGLVWRYATKAIVKELTRKIVLKYTQLTYICLILKKLMKFNELICTWPLWKFKTLEMCYLRFPGGFNTVEQSENSDLCPFIELKNLLMHNNVISLVRIL